MENVQYSIRHERYCNECKVFMKKIYGGIREFFAIFNVPARIVLDKPDWNKGLLRKWCAGFNR